MLALSAVTEAEGMKAATYSQRTCPVTRQRSLGSSWMQNEVYSFLLQRMASMKGCRTTQAHSVTLVTDGGSHATSKAVCSSVSSLYQVESKSRLPV